VSKAAGVLAATWWGHASATIEIAGVRVATDPVMTRTLMHLRRVTPPPPDEATRADVVLISHLHHDHLHLPSLRRFDPGIPLVVPKGTAQAVRSLRRRELVEVEPGNTYDVAGLAIQVLPARHDGRRDPTSRRAAPALSFRFTAAQRSCWYSGDTGVEPAIEAVDPVDLAVVAIGGWGPSLGDEHLSPTQAAATVARIGATWGLAVHYGTFWPVGMKRGHPRAYRRYFVNPPHRFVEAVEHSGHPFEPLTPGFGERLDLGI
jgi:L-ascorbate metabolism protein UlaG (beta-lactamase superfamily)